MSRRGLSILLLAYNEEGNVKDAVAAVVKAADAALTGDYEILIVDDGSTDRTWHMAQEAAGFYRDREYPDGDPLVFVTGHSENRGLRDAYETGLKFAHGERTVWLPSDCEMTTDSIARLFAAIGTADIVTPYHGNPEARPWFRRLLTFVSTWELNILMGRRLRYWQGTAVYDTDLARSLSRKTPGMFFCAEMLAHAASLGYTVAQTPLTHQERTYGVSKAVSFRRIWQAQMAVLGFWWRFRVLGEARRIVEREKAAA